MRIAFQTLGCKLNYAETMTYERKFLEVGFDVVSCAEKADVYIINTCCVTEHSEKKCRNIIRKMHRIAPEAVIVVTGCYAELKRKEISGIDGVKLVFGAAQKSRVVKDVLTYLSATASASSSTSATSSASTYSCDDFFPAYSCEERTRSFLKVQDGCDYFCTYCTVPYARGRSRNLPISSLVDQAREIAGKGIREIVITGVNTGDFGKTTGETFIDLLKALNEVEGIDRYRISSIEPNLLTRDIVDWIASGTKFLPHFHIPLQSGCDFVLQEMGRKYDTRTFAEKIDYIRAKMEKQGKPKVFLGIDVIAGFPGENDEMFEDTFSFLSERIKPAFIHVFPFSKRPGTRAAQRRDQVQESVKTSRVKKLEQLSSKLHSSFIESCKGGTFNVLFESRDKTGTMSGYTENYIRVEKSYNLNEIGKIIKIQLV